MSKFIGFAWRICFCVRWKFFYFVRKTFGFKFKFLSLSISFLFPFGNFKVEYSLWGSKIIIGIFFFKTSSSKTPTQQNLLFNILSNTTTGVNFDELIFALSNEENNSKWTLISQIEQLKKINLFSNPPTKLEDIVKHKQCSIISLKGVEPYICELFCSTLLRNLFEKRKREEIPPFLLVLEEAHNFCPEASLGKLKSTKIIRTLAGEGRKFGIGLCVISQRPAKVDKNVISQCTTQILLKITNPNDLKSVIASSEGVDSSSEQEIQKLNIGTCLLTGLIDIPLKINVRPRVSKHGGETVTITMPYEKENPKKSFNDDDENNLEEKAEKEVAFEKSNKNLQFIEHFSCEISKEEAQKNSKKL